MKRKMYLLVTAIMLTFAVSNSKAATVTGAYTAYTKEYIATMTDEQKQARIEEIKDRVDEIKTMDKSTLTHADKKELRAELRSMRHEATEINAARGGGGGIYLSVGAIIIIILLLILIL